MTTAVPHWAHGPQVRATATEFTPGEQVIVFYHWGNRLSTRQHSVARTTQTHVILDNGDRFYRHDSWMGWQKMGTHGRHAEHMVQASDPWIQHGITQQQEADERRVLATALAGATWEYFRLDFLREMKGHLDRYNNSRHDDETEAM